MLEYIKGFDEQQKERRRLYNAKAARRRLDLAKPLVWPTNIGACPSQALRPDADAAVGRGDDARAAEPFGGLEVAARFAPGAATSTWV